jgi:ElaB/YqjD/DUF883 family membrane-anchored ribosome-binding protein
MSHDDRMQDESGFDRMISTARKPPEALLLFAAGCALLMARSKGVSVEPRNLKRKARRARAYARVVAHNAYDQASSAAEPVRDYANRVGQSVSEAGQAAMSRAGDVAQQAGVQARSNLEHYVRAQPLAIGMLSLAVGAAIGAALPETEVENRTLGTPRDLLARKAQDLAAAQVQQLKEAAGEFGEKIMTTSDSGGGDRSQD